MDRSLLMSKWVSLRLIQIGSTHSWLDRSHTSLLVPLPGSINPLALRDVLLPLVLVHREKTPSRTALQMPHSKCQSWGQ
jgi:hypothetical protein